MSKLRIGIIGCGGIARRHVENLNAIPEVELVALCDTSDAIIDAFVERAGLKDRPEIQRYTDRGRFFAEAGLDAVDIITPHTFHFEHARIQIDPWYVRGSPRLFRLKENREEPVEIAEIAERGTTPLQNFVDAILGRDEPRTGPTNGLNLSRLMDSIYESAATGRIATASRGALPEISATPQTSR